MYEKFNYLKILYQLLRSAKYFTFISPQSVFLISEFREHKYLIYNMNLRSFIFITDNSNQKNICLYDT